MKKILFIITKAEWGGAQRFLFELATRLDKNYYESIIAAGESGELLNRLNNRGLETLILKNFRNRFGFNKFLDIF